MVVEDLQRKNYPKYELQETPSVSNPDPSYVRWDLVEVEQMLGYGSETADLQCYYYLKVVARMKVRSSEENRDCESGQRSLVVEEVVTKYLMLDCLVSKLMATRYMVLMVNLVHKQKNHGFVEGRNMPVVIAYWREEPERIR